MGNVTILLILLACWLIWQTAVTAAMLFALNVFLEHFGRTKIPHSIKTYLAATFLRSQIKEVLSHIASKR